ncbi:hypothetical protein [Phocaeicola plebeius]|uniref:hypothetical protein n=1 Tax=Phocaeicola plebeius TaxID=310297 RepID=UPI00307E8453
MKKIYTTFLFFLLGVFSTSIFAQSTVYFFMKKGGGNLSLNLKLNGKEISQIELPIKKTYPVNDTFRIPYYIYSPWVKKCTLNKEGKNLFSFDCKQINPTNLKESDYVAEIQLNLYNGSKHYIILTNKGLFDVQLKELTEKEAEKLLKNKKYVALPEYIEQ